MKQFRLWVAACCVAWLASACGGGSGSTGSGSTPTGPSTGTASDSPGTPPPLPSAARGALLQSPPARTLQLTAAELKQRMEQGSTRDEALLLVAGEPDCGVEVHSLQYSTVGATGEATTASGALMLPSGSGAACNGERPLLLYAHATNPAKAYKLAAMNDSANPAANEALVLATMYAARGYVVVAPDYAGYDGSTLPYHPFLHAGQQAGEMVDALAAARMALAALGPAVRAGGKLFLAGYSQGGHVAMAAHRALQQAGVQVTASAPMSGPYLPSRQLDDVFAGQVHHGSTLFATLLLTSYQRAYGNIYARAADLYGPAWATGIDTLLPGPGAATLLSDGLLPELALFSSTPPTAPAGTGLQTTLNAMTPASNTGTGLDAVFARGFGPQPLITNTYRLAYVQDLLAQRDAPRHPLRIAARANDLGDWTPAAPVLLCGGREDATVSWPTHTLGMVQRWAGRAAFAVLDVDERPPGVADPFIAERLGFALIKEATVGQARLEGKDPDWEVARNYHAAVFPFCASAARRFFGNF
ncbi:MAG TPA: alpha/beta hydrolase [Ramlibacter sp.]|nr:alpha/beta hydrolase [Ramlibacter sp.]